MKRLIPLILFGLSPLVFAEVIEPLRPERFSQFQGLIKPDTNAEKWQQIPWEVSLWEARKRAAALGKPILLWEMDGHPLGCT